MSKYKIDESNDESKHQSKVLEKNSSNNEQSKIKKTTRNSVTLTNPNIPEDVDVIEISRLLYFQPQNDTSNAKRAAKIIASKYNNAIRTRTQPSVIASHLILAVGYTAYLVYEQTQSQSEDNLKRIHTSYKTTALVVRIIAVLFALSIALLAKSQAWLQKKTHTEIMYLVVILGKSLCIAAIQLMAVAPDYGQLMFDQAFVWTFLPVHPVPLSFVSVFVWLAYGIPKWFGLLPAIPVLAPLIVVQVGLIQSYAHYRRYHGMMTGYLEAKRVDIQRREMSEESSKCDNLLKSMLPPSIIHKLEMGESITPERFDAVTVIFAEICHFSAISRRASAHELVHVLNDVFTTFDELIDKWSVYKVETVCQVYMAVAGCPHRDANHASQSANFALEMISSIQYLSGGSNDAMHTDMVERRQRCLDFFTKDENQDQQLEIHVGLNSGPVRAGVVGINNPRFKLFGDTVNTASRMESTCGPGRIQVSPSAFDLLTKSTTHAFVLEKRGEIQCKGKGLITTHYVNGSTPVLTTTVISAATNDGNDGGSGGRGGSSGSSSGGSTSAVTDGGATARSLVSSSLGLGETKDIEDQSTIVRRESGATPTTAKHKCTACMFQVRRLSLMVIEHGIDIDTLKALDNDLPVYRHIMFTSRLQWLQLKLLILLMALSFGLSAADYFAYMRNVITLERQVMTLLRNTVTIPMLILLLISCREAVWFEKYGEFFSTFSIFAAGAVMLVTIFFVYSGDPGIAAAMCILILDVQLLRLSWRVLLTFMLLIFYSVMIILTRGSSVVFTLATPFMVCALFIIAIHGQAHFSHLADRERRDLEMQTEQLQQVRKLKWELLTDLLPRPIANRLLAPVPLGEKAQLVADVYEDVTVLFTDMKGFTVFSSKLDPGALQHFLNGMFSAFDEILARWGLHKIEVIGDAYFVVSGAPSMDSNKDRTPDENAGFAAEAALAMIKAVEEVCGDPAVRIRVGLHSGNVVGGVVGQKDPRFHLFGHTVDLANKMEEFGVPDLVNCSVDTHDRLMTLNEDHLNTSPAAKPLFETEDRGMIEISGQPEPVHCYFIQKSSFGREHRSKARIRGKKNRGNDFKNSSLKFLSQKTNTNLRHQKTII